MKIVGAPTRPILDLPQRSRLRGLHAFVVDGEPLLVAGIQRAGEEGIDIIRAETGAIQRRIDLGNWSTNSGDFRTAILDRDSRPVLIGAFANQPIRQWSLPDGEVVAQWKGPSGWEALAVGSQPGTPVLLSVGDTVHQFDAATGQEAGPKLRTLERKRWFGSGPSVQAVAMAGDRILAGDTDGAVWCWEATSGSLVTVWRSVHIGQLVRMAAYRTADGWILVSIGTDMTVRLHDVATGRRLGAKDYVVGAREEMPRVAARTVGGIAYEILAATDLVIHRIDPATGAVRGPLVTFEADPPQENPIEDAAIDEICTVDGRPDVFAAAPYGIWRLDY